MPDYAALRESLVPFHGGAGTIALLAGIAALLVQKRRPWHPRAGWVFVISIGVSIAISVPIIVASNNHFLTFAGGLIAYHVFVAVRMSQLRPPRARHGATDKLINALATVLLLGMCAFGLWAILVWGNPMGAAPVLFASLGLWSVYSFHKFMRLEDPPPGLWVQEHTRGMTVAFIAATTAFSAAAGPRLFPSAPMLLLWLMPTLVLTPLFIFADRRRRARSD